MDSGVKPPRRRSFTRGSRCRSRRMVCARSTMVSGGRQDPAAVPRHYTLHPRAISRTGRRHRFSGGRSRARIRLVVDEASEVSFADARRADREAKTQSRTSPGRTPQRPSRPRRTGRTRVALDRRPDTSPKGRPLATTVDATPVMTRRRRGRRDRTRPVGAASRRATWSCRRRPRPRGRQPSSATRGRTLHDETRAGHAATSTVVNARAGSAGRCPQGSQHRAGTMRGAEHSATTAAASRSHRNLEVWSRCRQVRREPWPPQQRAGRRRARPRPSPNNGRGRCRSSACTTRRPRE